MAVGDSLAAGIAQTRKFNQTYDVHDDPAAKANPAILAASGRTTEQTLAQINANPKQYAGADVLLSTGMSNDLMGGRSLDDAMTNVASQLDALRAAGANVALAGVGSGVPGYQQANARLAQIAKAYNIPFTGEPATTQGGRVHPHDFNAFYGQFHFGEQPQPAGQQPAGQQPGSATGGGGDVRQDIINFWTSKGVPQHVAEGIAANARIESSFIPGAYNPDDKGSPSAGLFQAHEERLASLEKAVPDWRTNVAGQMQWAWDQVHGGDPVATAHWNEIMNAPDAQTAGVLWRTYFERPANVNPQDIANALNPDLSSGTLMRQYHEGVQAQKDLNAQQLAILQKEYESLGQEDPKRRALMDQILQARLDDMKLQREMALHPPTLQPPDALKNFGSLATLIGIFAGRFAHRPMVASLNAAGAAMQAMNDQNYEQYKTHFDTWKTQVDMFSKVVEMEHQAYSDILDDRKTTDAEKWHQMDIQSAIFQNQQAQAALAAGEPEKLLQIQKTIEETQKGVAQTQEYLTKANDAADKNRLLKAAVAQDDQKWITDNPADYQAWIKDHPERAGTVPPDVGFDHLTKRTQEMTSRALPKPALYQIIPSDGGPAEQVYGYKQGPGEPIIDMGNVAHPTAGATVLPMTPSEMTPTEGKPVPTDWTGKPDAAPPGYRQDVWDATISYVQTGKMPTLGMKAGFRDQIVTTVPAVLAAFNIAPSEMASRGAEFKVNTVRLTAMEKMSDSALAYEDTAIRNFDKAMELAPAAVPDWGPYLNRWIMEGETMLGDTNVPPYVAAVLTASTEYAKVMSGSTGAQASTDSARREAAERFSPYLNKGQIAAVVDLAKNDMKNRKSALTDRIAQIRGDLRGGQAAPSTTTPPPASAGPPHITNQADYDRLPSGAHFVGPDGQERVKP